MTVSATLDKTVRIYRANFQPLAILAAIVGLFQLPLVIVLGQIGQTPPSGRGSLAGQAVHHSMLLLVLAGVISMVGAPLQHGIMGAGAITAVAGRPLSLLAAVRAGLSRYFSLFGLALVAALSTMVGLLLLIVPGFYIFLGFALAGLVMMDEGLGVFASLRRSWSLANGKRGMIFGLFFAWAVLQVVLSMGISSLLRLFTIDAPAGPLGQALSQMLVLPCYMLSFMVVMDDVRTQREGRDLALEAQQVAAQAAPPGGSPTIDPPAAP
jgi:hypothetical protein